jgi:hypothetical protein
LKYWKRTFTTADFEKRSKKKDFEKNASEKAGGKRKSASASTTPLKAEEKVTIKVVILALEYLKNTK